MAFYDALGLTFGRCRLRRGRLLSTRSHEDGQGQHKAPERPLGLHDLRDLQGGCVVPRPKRRILWRGRRRGADWNRVGIDPGLPASAAEGGHPVRVLPGGCRACSRHWVEAASAAVRGFGLHKDREPIRRATES